NAGMSEDLRIAVSVFVISDLVAAILLVLSLLRDARSRAVLTLDRDTLTVREFALHRAWLHRWSWRDVKSITVGADADRTDLLARLGVGGAGPGLCVELASGQRRSVLNSLELNGELPWLASALTERAGAVEHEPSEPGHVHDLLLEIDSHLAEQGGRVT